MRMEGLPILNLWSQILFYLDPSAMKKADCKVSLEASAIEKYNTIGLDTVDYVPASMPDQSLTASLVMMEDNDAVIKMLQKGRAPALGHVARTHRVNLDWLLERLHIDPAIWCRYVESRHQLADVLTKPGFTKELWCTLLEQWRISPPPVPKPPAKVAVASNLTAMSREEATPSNPSLYDYSNVDDLEAALRDPQFRHIFAMQLIGATKGANEDGDGTDKNDANSHHEPDECVLIEEGSDIELLE